MLRVALVLTLMACGTETPAPSPEAHVLQGTGLGTSWTVKWMGDAPDAAVELAVVDALAEVDASMSTWRDDSDLARIRAASGPVDVSWETAHVVDEALTLARDSAGAFDPTVQPLVELWGFHGQVPDAIPTDDAVAAAMAQTGWQRVEVVRVGSTSQVDGGGTALDLSAIAKGWAVDRVATAVAATGVSDLLVEVGGETRTAGSGPNGAWTVGVERPVDAPPGTDFLAAVQPRNAAVATSGNYRSRVTIGDQSFGHTLDPRTGRPTDNSMRSATVIAPTCLEADGLATALMVLGEPGLALIEERPGVEALLVLAVEDGLREVSSTGFGAYRVR